MLNATLTRRPSTPHGTFGILRVPDFDFECHTLECVERGNATGVSCIPPGAYVVGISHSPRFGRDLPLLADVPGRHGIRIHPANFAGDPRLGFDCELEGCIALGTQLLELENSKQAPQMAVVNSRRAVDAFMQIMEGRTILLSITEGA